MNMYADSNLKFEEISSAAKFILSLYILYIKLYPYKSHLYNFIISYLFHNWKLKCGHIRDFL